MEHDQVLAGDTATVDEARCAPHVRVGTRAWDGDQQATSPTEANAQIGPRWVELDGHRYDCVAGPVVYRTGDDEHSTGIATITLTLVAASFEVVPEYAPTP